jgi:hypothetical protein
MNFDTCYESAWGFVAGGDIMGYACKKLCGWMGFSLKNPSIHTISYRLPSGYSHFCVLY